MHICIVIVGMVYCYRAYDRPFSALLHLLSCSTSLYVDQHEFIIAPPKYSVYRDVKLIQL